MTIKTEYYDDVEEYIEGMADTEFTKREISKMSVLRDQDTMENIWFAHQKNMEEYGMDKEESLKSTITEVLDNLSSRKNAEAHDIDGEESLKSTVMETLGDLSQKKSVTYRCPFCGSERFIGHQLLRADIYVDRNHQFDGNLPGGLEASVCGDPFGPFTCTKCGQKFNELPANEQVKLHSGTFTFVSGEIVRKFKEAGYSYSHEDNGYIVISNGTSAVAVRNCNFDRYYGGQRSFIL